MAGVIFRKGVLPFAEQQRGLLHESAGSFRYLHGWRGDRRIPARIIWGFFLVLVWFAANGATAEGSKRVLIVHSFGSAAPPFTTH